MSDPIVFTVPGIPVPWARAGARGSQRFTPAKQRKYMAALRTECARAMEGRDLISGPVEISVVGVFEWPKSMSSAKRAAPGAQWKITRPDSDNLVKIVEDALNPSPKRNISPIVWTDDAQVASLHCWKKYGDHPHLLVKIAPLAT